MIKYSITVSKDQIKNIKSLFGKLANLPKLLNPYLQLLGNDLNFKIRQRTQGGKDYKGSSFDEYSESYKKFREKKGRQTHAVNLTFTGQMLNSMSKTLLNNNLVLNFLNADQSKKAFYAHEKNRKFHLLSNAEKMFAHTSIDQSINTILKDYQ